MIAELDNDICISIICEYSDQETNNHFLTLFGYKKWQKFEAHRTMYNDELDMRYVDKKEVMHLTGQYPQDYPNIISLITSGLSSNHDQFPQSLNIITFKQLSKPFLYTPICHSNIFKVVLPYNYMFKYVIPGNQKNDHLYDLTVHVYSEFKNIGYVSYYQEHPDEKYDMNQLLFPHNLRILRIASTDITLQRHHFPNNLTELYFENHNYEFEITKGMFPDSLCVLSLGYYYDVEIKPENLPKSLHTLYVTRFARGKNENLSIPGVQIKQVISNDQPLPHNYKAMMPKINTPPKYFAKNCAYCASGLMCTACFFDK